MGLGDPESDAVLPTIGSGKKRSHDVLQPWDLFPAKVLRCGKKAAIEEATSYEELWAFTADGGKSMPYKDEYHSPHPHIRGVAISRFAQAMLALCKSITSEDSLALKEVLKPEVFSVMNTEATQFMEHLTILDGSGLPSKADGVTAKPVLGKTAIEWRETEKVRAAVAYLKQWFKKKSKLRDTVKTLQLGGLFYTAHVFLLCTRSYLICGEGRSDETMADDAVARLWQSSPGSGSTTKIE